MKLFLGYDKREDIVFKVAKDSLRRTSPSADVHALVQDTLRAWGYYERGPDERASTDFSLTRFLVPCLMEYEQSWAVFADCDFLFTRDVVKMLLPRLKGDVPLYCVKHDYTPRNDTKMGGKFQYNYPRKNWSSFMAFNCGHEANRLLTPSVINAAEPSWLHQLRWLDGYEIGDLPVDFNFLVGEYDPPEDAELLTEPTGRTPTCLHFTLGIGVFAPPVRDYANLWANAQREYLKSKQRSALAAHN